MDGWLVCVFFGSFHFCFVRLFVCSVLNVIFFCESFDDACTHEAIIISCVIFFFLVS